MLPVLQEQQEMEEREKTDRRAWIMQYMDNSDSEEGSQAGSDQVSVLPGRVLLRY